MELWSKDHPDGMQPLTEEMAKRIKSNMGDLVAKTTNDAMFWSYLSSYAVVDCPKRSELRNRSGNCHEEQVRELLLNDIIRGPKWKYKAFIRVLAETNQPAPIIHLKESPDSHSRNYEVDPHPVEDNRLLNEAEEGRIRSVFSQLTSNIRLEANVWALLGKYDVVSSERRDEIKDGQKRTAAQQIRELLDKILRGPKWKYHRFILALDGSRNGHIRTHVLDLSSTGSCFKPCHCEELLDENEQRNITNRYRSLTHSITVGAILWACLIGHEVISEKEKEEIVKDDTRSSRDQIRDLLHNVILIGPRYKYHALMRTLVRTNSQFLVEKIGENAKNYSYP